MHSPINIKFHRLYIYIYLFNTNFWAIGISALSTEEHAQLAAVNKNAEDEVSDMHILQNSDQHTQKSWRKIMSWRQKA